MSLTASSRLGPSRELYYGGPHPGVNGHVTDAALNSGRATLPSNG